MVVKKPRVIIVGAGMAGLTAAHRLFTASGDFFDLSVVEAGERIGGRILSSEFAGDGVEMGATWIHGIGGSPIYALARDLDFLRGDDNRPWERMDGFPTDPLTVAEGGARVDDALVVAPISSLYRRLMDSARAGDVDPPPVPDGDPGVAAFLRRGLRAYRSSSRPAAARAAAAAAAAAGDGAWSLEALEDAVFAMHENTERTCTSADDLADLDLAAEGEYRDFPGDQITIARGYSRIVEHLAGALPDGAIRLGRRLRRLEWFPDGGPPCAGAGPVRLHFADGAVADADHVILTVSLGVLKAGLGKEGGVAFDPPLPDVKRGAIGRLGFGVVNKLFMEAEAEAFPFLQMAFAQEGPGRSAAKIPRWIRKTASICPIYGGSRVLLAWFAGEEALQLEALDDEDVIRGAHAAIEGFLPLHVDGTTCNGTGPSPSPSRWRIARVRRSRWGTDPLFLGSYSYVAVGSSGDDLDLMAEPLPRGAEGMGAAPLQILFGGEATHRTHYSTTHGAYFSGIREANRLLQHYRCVSSSSSNSSSSF